MTLLIDASNIHAGGGQTHLIEILRHGRPTNFGFSKVMVCAPCTTLEKIEDKPWLEKLQHPSLDKNYFFRWRWRNWTLPRLLKRYNAFLFCVSTLKPPFAWPYVTICQNLLPIDRHELFRFGFSLTTLRLLTLRFLHFKSYRKAAGVIFLTRYCHEKLPAEVRAKIRNLAVIPHGLNRKLFSTILPETTMQHEPFRLLYVSIVNLYKHQDKVAQAVINLNRKGVPVKLTLIGKAYPPALRRLRSVLEKESTHADAVDYKGFVPYEAINGEYNEHDAFIFASTCETFGMIVTEAMAMGMPLLCSQKSSLPETVQDAALYFDPEDAESIEVVILKVIHDQKFRAELAGRSLKRSEDFAWDKCADATFNFIYETARFNPHHGKLK